MHNDLPDFRDVVTESPDVYVTSHDGLHHEAALSRNSHDTDTETRVVCVSSHANPAYCATLPHPDTTIRDDATAFCCDYVTNYENPIATSRQRRPGRPRKSDALSNAERARNYRARKKARAAELRNPEVPVSSEIIDLSELPAWKRK